MIHIKDVIKIYTTEAVKTTALAHLDLSIEKGEFVAVMGPSGCGKSTLLNVLGLLDCVCRGTYELDGQNVTRMGERERTQLRNGKIGFVFQSFNLIDELSVAENVELPLLYSREPRTERCRRAHQLLERMGIAHRAAHYPQQLSGGQKQRAAIARAMVTRPKLILADEPTGNLDYKTGRDVMTLLRELNEEGTTVVMVTHSEADAAYAKRRVYLQDGRVVTPREPAPEASGKQPQTKAPVPEWRVPEFV